MLILNFPIKNEKLIHESSLTKINSHSNNSLYINEEDSFINFTNSVGLVFWLVSFRCVFFLVVVFGFVNELSFYHLTM